MALRPEYSLGHSEYNAFLFAAVGEEKVGLPLTVLTALARQGVDPWDEAARLADLPREAAARILGAVIAKLPEGDWKASDSEAIATRLVKWLPGRSALAIPSVASGRNDGRVSNERPVSNEAPVSKVKPGLGVWLMWGVLAVAFLFLMMNLQTSSNPDTAPNPGAVTRQ